MKQNTITFLLFFLSFVENRRPILLFLAILMAFIWIDDAFRYHEVFGRHLRAWFDLPVLPGLREQDTGEIVAWAIAGFFLFPLLLYGLLSRQPGDLGVLALIAVGFGVLVVCGIFMDLLHIAVTSDFDLAVGVIEDGGEMLAIAYMASVSIGLSRNGERYFSRVTDLSPGSSPSKWFNFGTPKGEVKDKDTIFD